MESTTTVDSQTVPRIQAQLPTLEICSPFEVGVGCPSFGAFHHESESAFVVSEVDLSVARFAENVEPLIGHIRELEHDLLAKLVHHVRQGDFLYLVWDCQGWTPLREFIKSGSLQPDHSNYVIRQVAEGLQSLHDQNLIHGLLMPETVLVSNNGHVKLISFGIAELLQKTPVGHYMPPELRWNHSLPTETSDIFALGVVYFETLGRRLPNLQFLTLPTIAGLNYREHTEKIIMRALQPTAQERYGTVGEFIHDLDNPKGVVLQEKSFAKKEDDTDILKEQEKRRKHASRFGFIFMTCMILLVAGAGVWFLNEVAIRQEKMADSWKAALGEVIRGLEQVSEGNANEGDAMIKNALKNMPDNPDFIKAAVNEAMKRGLHEKAKDMAEIYPGYSGEEADHTNELKAYAMEVSDQVETYDGFMVEAARGRELLDFPVEKEKLESAIDTIPVDPIAPKKLRKNPVWVEEKLDIATDETRSRNAGQKDWNVNFFPGPGDVRLDLGDHPEMKDISSFAGLPVHELDLSNTGVTRLEAISSLPLKSLNLDGTKVENLAPIYGKDLELLTFEDLPIQMEDGAIDKVFPKLKVARGTLNGKPYYKSANPVEVLHWVNPIGMHFAKADGDGLMVSVFETRVRDFALYTDAQGLPVESESFRNTLPQGEVSLLDAQRFCEWLTQFDREAGWLTESQTYRLPTDEEWSMFSGVGMEHAHLDPISRGYRGKPVVRKTHREQPEGLVKVGLTEPFQRLYDLSGNLREWCADPMYQGATLTTIRGAGWRAGDADLEMQGDPKNLRYRSGGKETLRLDSLGFRVVLDLGTGRRAVPALGDELERAGWGAMFELATAQSADATLDTLLRKSAETLLELSALRESMNRNHPLPKMVYVQEGEGFLLVDVPLSWKQANLLAMKLGATIGSVDSVHFRSRLAKQFKTLSNPASFWVADRKICVPVFESKKKVKLIPASVIDPKEKHFVLLSWSRIPKARSLVGGQ